MDIEKVSIIGAVVTSIIISVAIAVQAGLTRRQEKKRFDSQTQTAHTFVRSVYLGWNPPKTVPVCKWKLSWGTPEVWRFETTDDPFYARPILTAGQFRPNAGTKDAEEFEKLLRQVGGEEHLIDGPPANA